MSGKVVVDASVALKWVVVEADSSLAHALLNEWANNGITMLAPVLYTYEVANILHQRTRRGFMTPDTARDALSRLLAIDVELDRVDDKRLSARALELAQQHGLPATYDAHYLALAEREGCSYWTADERLWNAVKARLPWVRWLGELSARAAAPPSPSAAP